MKKLKLFSLALMALFATNLWAADPDIAFEIPVSGATKADYFKGWNIGTSVVTLSATMDLSSNDSNQNISITSNAGNLNANYISIKVTTGSETIDSIAVYAGGSGPACLPLVAYSYVINKMKKGEINRVLLVATGALMSPTMVNQKLSIPSIAHAISLEVI